MATIIEISGYTIKGILSLTNPPNSPTPEELQEFSWQLAFMDLENDRDEERIRKLLKEAEQPPYTQVFEATGDATCTFILLYSPPVVEMPDELNTFDELCAISKRFIDPSRARNTRFYSAQQFYQNYEEAFRTLLDESAHIDTAKNIKLS